MSMVALFGKLREHELEFGRLNEEEDIRRKKNTTFKYEIFKGKNQEEDDDYDFKDMDLMMKMFTKFIKSVRPEKFE